jgi:hypothetical protein
VKHYDELTLELFVKRSTEVAPFRAEIELHVKECNSCRELVRDLTEYHEAMSAGEPLLLGKSNTINANSPELRPMYSRGEPVD